MTVKKTSWHYKLVKHKKYISEIKLGNKNSVAYIAEVGTAIYFYVLIVPLVIFAILVLALEPKSNSYIFIICLIGSFPFWFTVLCVIVEQFTKKKWRELKVVKQ